MKAMALVSVLMTSLAQVLPADIEDTRVWTGTNGATFTGCFQGEDPDTGKYRFLAGKRAFLIEPTNLSAPDRAWLYEQLFDSLGSEPKMTGFVPTPRLKRADIPVINQSRYGQKSSDCYPSSFCNFVLWWDQQGFLPIGKRGDFDDKSEYIHTRMARHFRTRNTAGTSRKNAYAGVAEYFDGDLSHLATFRTHFDPDCRIENLRKYVEGARATLLSVTVYHGRREQGGHAVALADIANGDTLVLHTWGCRIEGRMKLLEEKIPVGGTHNATASRFAIEFINGDELPEWIVNNEVRFEIDPEKWDGLSVVTPYRFAVEGSALPAPSDQLLAGGNSSQREHRFPPKRFNISLPPLDEDFTFTRGMDDPGGMNPSTFSQETRDVFASVGAGSIPVIDEGSFEFQMQQRNGESFPARLSFSDHCYRIDYPEAKTCNYVVVDLDTKAFLSRCQNSVSYIGRLPDEAFPRAGLRLDSRELRPWMKLRADLSVADPDPEAGWPSRRVELEKPRGNRGGADLGFSLARLRSKSLYAGLQMLLDPIGLNAPTQKDLRFKTGLFVETARPRWFLCFDHVAAALATLESFPTRIRITREFPVSGTSTPQTTTLEFRLTEASAAPQPGSLFQIPEEALEVEPGFFVEWKEK